jgi:D-alanyl-lipoteichoic acid acyltransferase DltB (MBOAT superfamily)
MLFNSFSFLIFLPIVYALFWGVHYAKGIENKLTWQHLILLSASYFFYAYWNIWFLLLLIFSTSLDFYSGQKVANNSGRLGKKTWFWLSIGVNFALLGFFKYYNFIVSSLADLAQSIDWSWEPTLLLITLPVGISFYTFHGLSYVIDIYHDRIKPEKDMLVYGLFVCFFPLLVAGPIERANHLIPQLKEEKKFNRSQSIFGLQQMLWGFFKKIVIADNCAVYVNQIFAQHETLNSGSLLVGAVLFSFQIYGDFSGYSDIALGTARLFGIELLNNFNFPYFAKNVSEFWKRWHISLTSWFRDYLYIPLGGNRVSKLRRVGNTLTVFLVSGLWHGASWTYVFWGFLNGLFLVPQAVSKRFSWVSTSKLVSGIRILITFGIVTLFWVFFRAKSIGDALAYLGGMIQHGGWLPDISGRKNLVILGVLIVGFMGIEWLGRQTLSPLVRINALKNRWIKWTFYYSLMVMILYFYRGNDQFIYFQF